MKKTVFKGSAVAIITPFTENGVNFDELGRLIEYHIENKTDAIVICGTTGEASTMPDEEHCMAIKYTVDKVAGRIPVIAGTGSNDTPHPVKLSRFAESAGADGAIYWSMLSYLAKQEYTETFKLAQLFKLLSEEKKDLKLK